MRSSESINELAAALAKAQGQMEGAKKDAANPFYKSKYADLASVWEACREPLSGNGLSIIQSPAVEAHGEPELFVSKSKSGEDRVQVKVATKVSVTTRLAHSSGQWVEGTGSAILPFGDPQAVGSAITYLRRYALAAFTGVAPEDDDGEAAHGRDNGPRRAAATEAARDAKDSPSVDEPRNTALSNLQGAFALLYRSDPKTMPYPTSDHGDKAVKTRLGLVVQAIGREAESIVSLTTPELEHANKQLREMFSLGVPK